MFQSSEYRGGSADYTFSFVVVKERVGFSPLNNEEGPRTQRTRKRRSYRGYHRFSPLNNEEGPRTSFMTGGYLQNHRGYQFVSVL